MITFFFKNLLPHIGRFEQKNVLQKFQRKMRKAKENIWFYLSIRIIVIVEERGISVIFRLVFAIKSVVHRYRILQQNKMKTKEIDK